MSGTRKSRFLLAIRHSLFAPATVGTCSPSGRVPFRDITRSHENGNGAGMTSESVGGIFGAIVAAVVLAVAVVFGPIGQYGKPPKPKAAPAAAAAQAAPVAPAPRGPVIREVPNQ